MPSSLLRFVIFPDTNIAPRLGMVSSLFLPFGEGGDSFRSDTVDGKKAGRILSLPN